MTEAKVEPHVNAPIHEMIAHPDAARKAAAFAARAARSMARPSSDGRRSGLLIDLDRVERDLPKFSPQELLLGGLLGRGGFCDVHEVRGIRLLDRDDDERDGDEQRRPLRQCRGHPSSQTVSTETDDSLESKRSSSRHGTVRGGRQYAYSGDQRAKRSFLAQHCLRDKSENFGLGVMEARYAVKFLSESTVTDPVAFQTGAVDLAAEALFLANLSHPHVVRIRGISAAGTAGFASGTTAGYFLLLDRLYGTLNDKIDEWSRRQRKLGKFVQRKFVDKGGAKRRALLGQRVKVAFDVCAALAYLHSRNIVYRDVKPDNIGFDVRGDVKLFDLGLAKELRAEDEHPNDPGTYQLSGQTGSLRYMAPEVARCQPYNLSADVYAFSVLLWQILSLELPFRGMGSVDHTEHVVYGAERPTVNESTVPCPPLRGLLLGGWQDDAARRPAMDEVYMTLRAELGAIRGGDEEGLDHVRRRSTFTMPSPLPEEVPQQYMDAATDAADDYQHDVRCGEEQVQGGAGGGGVRKQAQPRRGAAAPRRVTRNATAA